MRSPALMDRPGTVYLAVNRINHKAYVGKTTKTLAQRFEVHGTKARNGYRSHFYSAVRKYGWEVFDIAILEICTTTEALNLAEIRWIATLGSKAPVGYNTTDGGEGCNGVPKTDIWRASVTSDQYRAIHSVRAKLWRAGMTPRQRADHQAKISAKAKGRIVLKTRGDNNPSKRPEVRAKISASKLGKPRPESLKLMLSQIAKAKWEDPEYRSRCLAARTQGPKQ